MKKKIVYISFFIVFILSFILTSCIKVKNNSKKQIEIINVSYDATREFYEDYNDIFSEYWNKKTEQNIEIVQSNGGSGKQARAVIEGMEADVVTLALGYDISAIEKSGLINESWQSEFKYNSSPYTSTIVFLVRKNNPKSILDWDDLVKGNVDIITPNPKTSGGARWNYLAAWAYADKEFNGDEAKIKEFIKKIYENVLILDSGARASTINFVENRQGDVLLAWENEAYLSLKEHPNDYEIITPSISILAEPPVAIVDSVVDKRGTREVSTEYLEYLYSDIAQRLAGENYYRPINENILAEFSGIFNLNLKLVKIDDDIFGGWENAQKVHFDDGGLFDQIYTGGKK